uniref:Macaca fascicularis brain cDNA clone: QflA-17530, similar to human preimplantation protein 3 (PREI3), transcript variant 2, mRNA, RefSeq: NM_199482.1 n=1 Tax=Macaca fascicularis TaxID=9541 RepID=I7GMM1_MACFA|nr:unnamed protein product [Macaca fascicularis]
MVYPNDKYEKYSDLGYLLLTNSSVVTYLEKGSFFQ